MISTRDEARAVLKVIEQDAKSKIEAAGGVLWSRVGDDNDGVTLVVKIQVPPGEQTKITEFDTKED